MKIDEIIEYIIPIIFLVVELVVFYRMIKESKKEEQLNERGGNKENK